MSDSDRTLEQKKMEARLKELDARIQLFEAQAERVQADARTKGRSVMERLREQREAAARELDKYRSATGAALEKVGEGLKRAMNDLTGAVDEAQKTFSAEKQQKGKPQRGQGDT